MDTCKRGTATYITVSAQFAIYALPILEHCDSSIRIVPLDIFVRSSVDSELEVLFSEFCGEDVKSIGGYKVSFHSIRSKIQFDKTDARIVWEIFVTTRLEKVTSSDVMKRRFNFSRASTGTSKSVSDTRLS
jgi:hypothetical protein